MRRLVFVDARRGCAEKAFRQKGLHGVVVGWEADVNNK